jgi:16S rRNA G966 N2-methylase RsmD
MLEIKKEFKDLIPALTAEEFKQLEDNCLAEGIREKILTWNGVIIDGHNRYEIATKWNLDYDTESKFFKSEDDVKEWMILNQFGRRNLSNYQRSVLALELEGLFKEKATENLKLSGENFGKGLVNSPKAIEKVDTRKELSKVAGVGEQTMARVKVIQEKAPEEVKEKLKTGEVSINQAYQEIKKEEKKEKKEEERRILAEEGAKKKIDIDFRLGDFEEVFADIPDGSIDCIITDPPYPYEFIEVWTKLSRFAKRVLKPNGYCIAYSGQMYLPEVMTRMSEHLDYYWTFAVYHEGQTQIVNGINLMCRWKPVLIFQNGKKKIDRTFQDYFISEQREKNGHDWQQSKSGVAYLIEMFTNEGDTILEPFAGSGTTMIAAREKNRNVIGAEIDEKTFNIAKALL